MSVLFKKGFKIPTLLYSPNFWQSLINIRSTQRSTSEPSSELSARQAAIRAINTAAASWSKLAAMCGSAVAGSAQLRAIVVTRTRRWPLAC